MERHRLSSTAKMGIALCFVAVALLGYGLKTERWFSLHTPLQYGQAGLRTLSVCDGDGQGCESYELGEPSVFSADEEVESFLTVAKVTTALGIATAAALLLSSILLMLGKFVFVPFAPASAAILLCVAALALALFTAQKNPLYDFGFRSDFSFIAFLMGTGIGFVGAIFVGRERPDDWL